MRRELAGLETQLGVTWYGSDGPRRYAVTRQEAQRALRDFCDRRLDGFGPLQDAVADGAPFLWHSVLSAPLNLGLLHPLEVCNAVDKRWRERQDHRPPLSSYEGFLRQVCGWREYVWGLYWLRMPGWRSDDALGQHGPVPAFFWDGDTPMNCVSSTVTDVLDRAWVHHIPRLMILGNYALLAGVSPQALADWFHALFVDGYDWVMAPNVVGMSQWADGGVMATKPYAASANYLHKMTTYCDGCAYDRTARTRDGACPFNALYWDFLDRHRETLARNHRMLPILSNLDRFGDEERAAIRDRAAVFRADVS